MPIAVEAGSADGTSPMSAARTVLTSDDDTAGYGQHGQSDDDGQYCPLDGVHLHVSSKAFMVHECAALCMEKAVSGRLVTGVFPGGKGPEPGAGGIAQKGLDDGGISPIL